MEMPPKLASLKSDQTTASALRLMRIFLKLRNLRHREEVIALAERLVEQEARDRAMPAGSRRRAHARSMLARAGRSGRRAMSMSLHRNRPERRAPTCRR